MSDSHDSVCVFDGDITQAFDAGRYLASSIGRSTQHDFEARWQRVEHMHCITRVRCLAQTFHKGNPKRRDRRGGR